MDAAAIVVRVQKGRVTISAMGRTPRGTKYIKATKALDVKGFRDKNFKAQLKTAIAELLASEA